MWLDTEKIRAGLSQAGDHGRKIAEAHKKDNIVIWWTVSFKVPNIIKKEKW